MTILFTGGGTMGPVTPLLAVMRQMRKIDSKMQFAWVGTPDGPEREVIKKEGIPFYEIPVAKFPRYISLRWGTFPFHYFRARRSARKILKKLRPDLVVSAGAFSSVPVLHEAKKHGILCATHQLDYKLGIANKIMARWADLVTTTFEYKDDPFPNGSSQVTTPCRFANKKCPSLTEARKRFDLDPARSTVLFFGGGTGALAVNSAVDEILETLLPNTQVIHLTGKGKGEKGKRKNYRSYPFLDEDQMLDAYCASDLIVSRAGLGSISEFACLKQTAILIPIPNSHQEENARHMPFPIVEQNADLSKSLLKTIRSLINNDKEQKNIGEHANKMLPTDDGTALAKKWFSLLKF
ncbi:MAG: glycosyltransferase [bacterium]|nr:glycosyltransferase [bacterium]